MKIVSNHNVKTVFSYCRYRKAFELQPSQYSGMNLAILLVASGKDLSKSEELQRVCEFFSFQMDFKLTA